MPVRKKVDLRIVKTRKALFDALVQLGLEHGFEQVTVRDLTQTANLGYATFFRHFPSKESLLQALLDDALEGLIAHISPLFDAPKQMLVALFGYIEEHATLFALLLKTKQISDLYRRVETLGVQLFLSRNQPVNNAQVPLEVAANHIIASSFGMFEWWLQKEIPYSKEKMAEIFILLILDPVYQVAAMPRDEVGLGVG
jgi:AcrR family transcriptional regulator